MLKIGPQVKAIRTIKGLTQKEVYQGVVSPSFAIRFEQGRNDMKATSFLAVLANLGVSPDEFQYLLQGHQVSPVVAARLQIDTWYGEHNFEALSQWISDQKTATNPQVKTLVALAEVLLISYDRFIGEPTPSMQALWQQLSQTKTWTLQEIKLVRYLIPALRVLTSDPTALNKLQQKMMTNCQIYLVKNGDPFQIKSELVDFNAMLFQEYLNRHDYQAAASIQSAFTQFENTGLSWDTLISQRFWLAIWQLYFGDATAGREVIAKINQLQQLFPQRPDRNLDAIYRYREPDARHYRQRAAND
ncbi:helix-turn-helix domain-containing protein [Lapidilactobacillus wuchangensis]|uniref:helix-turn-helix domain-containing protein n=1 Tax=Lapidilactobacillus wuchangensis TaxID=2486001 RepID=UPI000F7B3E30|nr:helix-turn-helix transcriptional regulator [Lapidilactobacillus wuchangensis]